MRLDNKLIAANITEQGDNIILCTNLQEAFFDVYSFDIQGETFIKKADKVVDGCPVVSLNVEYNGIEYKDVEFKLQQDAQENVFLSEQSLLHGQHYVAPAPAPSYVDQLLESAAALQEPQEPTPEYVAIAPRVDAQQLKHIAHKDQQNKLKKTLRNIYEKLNYELKHDLQHAKQSMLQETLQVQQDVKQSVHKSIDETKKSLKQEFLQLSENINAAAQLFTEQAIDSFKDQVIDKCTKLSEQTNQVHLENLHLELKQDALDAKASIQKSLEQKLNNKFEKILETANNSEHQLKQFVEQQLQTVQGLIREQQMQLFEQSTIDLMRKQSDFIDEVVAGKVQTAVADASMQIVESVEKLNDERLTRAQSLIHEQQMQLFESSTHELMNKQQGFIDGVVADKVNAAVCSVSQQLTEHVDKVSAERLQTVEQQVEQVLQEHFASASQDQVLEEAAQQTAIAKAIRGFKDQFSADVQNRINAMQTDLYRKFAIYAESMGGGGGSVAVQYANGGTMNGSLNVATGQILSAGVDLASIFAGGGGSGYQTLVFTPSSSSLTITPFGNTVSLSSLGGGTATGAYLPLSGGTVTGNVTVAGTLSATTFYATSAFITVVDVTQYELSGFNVTGNVTVNGLLSSTTMATNYIDFTPLTVVPAQNDGRLYYDQTERTLVFWDGDPTLKYPINKMLWTIGVNKTGSIIPKGTVVYLSGAQGNRGKMWPAIATNDVGSADTIGVTMQDTAINQEGYIMAIGELEGIDTRAYAEGTTLYLSPLSAGKITDVKPQAPNHLVKVGFSLNSTVNGKIYVEIDNGYELNELHNVRINGVANGQVLTYNSLSSIWVNATPQTAYLPLSGGTLTGAVSTNQDIEITDSTKGIILKSPGGFKYRITVTDAGELVTTSV